METDARTVDGDGIVESETAPHEFPKIFKLIEHQKLNDAQAEYLRALEQNGIRFKETEYEGEPSYLGIMREGDEYRASYYIGAEWLAPLGGAGAEQRHAVIITPKMQEIDFIEMFLIALKCTSEAKYFSRFYGIDFSKPAIETDTLENVLTPLILIHFVCLLEKIARRGLKKSFVLREENLNCKIKGRLLVSKNIEKNLCMQRQERMYCSYQEWTCDTAENRLLKKALHFSRRMLRTMNAEIHPKLKEVERSIAKIFPLFEQVSDEIQPKQVSQIKPNKCWREYADALRTARMILRRFEYSVEKAGQNQTSVPPFWIDMSRLYEMYVYSKLKEAYGDEIGFQEEGYRNSAVDFIKKDERLIMDAKYKPRYKDSNAGILDDIRKISGYARDTRIRRALGVDKDDTEEIKCLIICPESKSYNIDEEDEEKKEETNPFADEPLLCEATQIQSFRGFYKLCIPLPEKKGG